MATIFIWQQLDQEWANMQLPFISKIVQVWLPCQDGIYDWQPDCAEPG